MMPCVGRSVPSIDGWEKVTGAASYAADISFPGMLHARLVLSPYPHAQIDRVNSRRALAIPGVRAVVTYESLTAAPGARFPVLRLYGQSIKDRPILAHERVRFAGEPVAIVVADDETTAWEASRLVDIDYLALPAAPEIDTALAGEILLHGGEGNYEITRSDIIPDYRRNICGHTRFVAGEPERAIRESDLVVEDTFYFPSLFHYPMEPHCAVGIVEKDSVSVYSSTQAPFQVRDELAHIFGIDPERIRVVAPFVGGGFGSKGFAVIEPLVVAAAAMTGSAVKLRLSQEETAHTTRRHPARIKIRSGLSRDGSLICREVTIHLDTGAYADFGPLVTRKAAFRAFGPYRLTHGRSECYAVYTNKLPSGAFRGIGSVQTAWACEAHTDHICVELGMDPTAFRRKNLLRAGERYVLGGPPLDGSPLGVFEACVDRHGELETGLSGKNLTGGESCRVGTGVACTIKDVSTSLYEAEVEVGSDGEFLISANAPEIGGGARTVLSQIAADVLGVTMDSIRLAPADTRVTPRTSGVFGSRITTLMGAAVKDAAAKLKNDLLARAAVRLRCAAETLSLANGCVRHPEGVAMRIADLVREEGRPLRSRGVIRPREDAEPIDICTWEINAGIATVSVDAESGRIQILAYISAADVGRAIHPLKCVGQEEGAVMFGIGNTLFEEQFFDGGVLLNGSPVDYRVPKFTDLPQVFEGLLIENGDGPGPFGSKGMAEGGLAPVAPAVASAVRSAVGISVSSLPLSPERVIQSLTSGHSPERPR
jgi:CO/xanthine dehydrogenase Mo-binding subunit